MPASLSTDVALVRSRALYAGSDHAFAMTCPSWFQRVSSMISLWCRIGAQIAPPRRYEAMDRTGRRSKLGGVVEMTNAAASVDERPGRSTWPQEEGVVLRVPAHRDPGRQPS